MFKFLLASTVSLWAVAASAADYEVHRSFDSTMPPGNIAIGPDGRMFLSVHEFYGPELRVVELTANGEFKPYPSEDWARAPSEDGDGLNGVLGLRVDQDGILWMLDGQTDDRAGRVVAWNTKSETLHKVLYLPKPVTRASSFLNDLAVDRTHETIYVADTGDGQNSALIVLDLETGRARRVLEGSEFTIPENLEMVIDGREIVLGGSPAKIGVNPITIDPTNTWLYFAPMSATSLYRVRTADLRDENLSDADLAARVERYGDKVISDGSTVDAGGNVYITAMTDNAIGVTKPDGTYEVLYQSAEELSWTDGFAIGPDGYIYVTVNELHNSPVLNEGVNASSGNFRIVRFKSLAEAVSGR